MKRSFFIKYWFLVLRYAFSCVGSHTRNIGHFMETYVHFVTADDMKSFSVQVKWYETVRVAEELETLCKCATVLDIFMLPVLLFVLLLLVLKNQMMDRVWEANYLKCGTPLSEFYRNIYPADCSWPRRRKCSNWHSERWKLNLFGSLQAQFLTGSVPYLFEKYSEVSESWSSWPAEQLLTHQKGLCHVE